MSSLVKNISITLAGICLATSAVASTIDMGPVLVFEEHGGSARVQVVRVGAPENNRAILMLENVDTPENGRGLLMMKEKNRHGESYWMSGRAGGVGLEADGEKVLINGSLLPSWGLRLPSDGSKTKARRMIAAKAAPGADAAKAMLSSYQKSVGIDNGAMTTADAKASIDKALARLKTSCAVSPNLNANYSVFEGSKMTQVLPAGAGVILGWAKLCDSDADFKGASSSIKSIVLEKSKDQAGLNITKNGSAVTIQLSMAPGNPELEGEAFFKDNL